MWIHSWKWKWKWNTAMRCSFEVNQSCCTDPPCRRSIWSFELALYRHNMPATDNHASNMLIWLVEWAWKASHLIGYPDSHAKQPPNFHRALGPMGMPSLLNPLPLESWPRKNMILKNILDLFFENLLLQSLSAHLKFRMFRFINSPSAKSLGSRTFPI